MAIFRVVHATNPITSPIPLPSSETGSSLELEWRQEDGPVFPRQIQSSTTTTGLPTTTSDRPFFPDPASVTPVPSSNPDGHTGGLAKAVLEYAILAVGIAVVACFVLHRFLRLRRANQPTSRFFSLSSFNPSSQSLSATRPVFPRTHGLSSFNSDLLPSPAPLHLHGHHPPSHRVTSADIDAFGRRIGAADLYTSDKDQLPPYESSGGPPKYFELSESFRNSRGRNESESTVRSARHMSNSTMNCSTIYEEHTLAEGNGMEASSQLSHLPRVWDDFHHIRENENTAITSTSAPPGLRTDTADRASPPSTSTGDSSTTRD